MKTIKSTQSGLSLIELMISITLGLLLLAGVITIYGNSVRSSSNAMQTAKLNQELRAIMLMMTNDIRRAGYNGNAAAGIGAVANVNVFRTINTSTAGCILFSYDQDNDGNLDTSPSENFGFERAVQNGIGIVYSRGDNAFCNTGGEGGWQGLSDPYVINITALTFTPRMQVSSVDTDGNGTPDLWIGVRTYDITLSGQLTNDATVTRTLTETVRVRNDLLSTTALIAIP